ncbi:MAG: tetratricopeptide (TPR) repeat protein [Candidatus Paceibacteria bacterium]|jgi:tetratricopeptide (TPR) repeat protein
MFDRFLNRGRARVLSRNLAAAPSIENYIALAQSHANSGQLQNVTRVCEEGLDLHPDCCELQRLKERSQALIREDRVRSLQRDLKTAPRPALYKELCEIQLEAGHLARAEKVAEEWEAVAGDCEAILQRAHIRTARFFADRRRDDARVALDLIARYLTEEPSSEVAMRLSLEIYSRAGAWQEARKNLARLLELHPGDPSLEARFRTIAAMAERAPGLDQALREVERSGNFIDDDLECDGERQAQSIRPLLQTIAARPGVLGAFFVQGGTALVQGPRGASAERYARGVRELVGITRGAVRRLGLGRPLEVEIEGSFGSLTIRPGSLGAGALWSDERSSARTREALGFLLGDEAGGGGLEA